MSPCPDCCRHSIIERRREGVFGRQTVIDREHHVSGDFGKAATECVALLDSTLHVPSAMEIQHDRISFRAVWRIDASRNGGVDSGNRNVLDAAYRHRLTGNGGCPEIAECLTNLRNRQRPLRLVRVRQLGFNELLQCRVECHLAVGICLRGFRILLAALRYKRTEQHKTMRNFNWRPRSLVLSGICAVLSACVIPGPASNGDEFQLSFAAGSRDSAGRFMGGTEMRLLTGHGGKLYAGNGYWQARRIRCAVASRSFLR